jgi:hypothetical protein
VSPAAAGEGAASGVLVLVTGTGRSGTSTIAGTLHHLGLEVPGPYLGANRSNPRGFFESRWATRFHKRITEAAGINDMDSRPTAFARAQAAVTAERRDELRRFLSRRAVGHAQVVVKDPRSIWVQAQWRDCARELGLDTRFLTMLRHPAEVVGSRSTYYADRSDEERQRRYEVFTVARWVNNSLVSERETRRAPRSFVLYNDLLADWRSTVAKVADELDLELVGDLAPGTHHAVDDFIDPDLRRVRVTWEDLSIPRELEDIAEETWGALTDLASPGADVDDACARLDALSARYERLFVDSSAICHDALEEAAADARADERRRADQARERPAPPEEGEDRRIRDVGGRELLTVAWHRLARRVRRT